MASRMIRAFVRARNLLVKRPIRTQTKNFCEVAPPSQKDFLSRSVGGDPFYIVPFQFKNHLRFTIVFLIFFSSGFWAVPLVVHLQIYKRQQN